MNAQQWDPIARRIGAAWPDTPMTPERSEVYLDVLSDLDADHVATAVNALLREGREDPPPPGVVRERAVAVARAGAGQAAAPERRRGVSPVWVVLGVLAVAAAVIVLVVLVVNATGDDGATTTDAPATITQTTTEAAPTTVESPTVTTESTVTVEPEPAPPDGGAATDAVP